MPLVIQFFALGSSAWLSLNVLTQYFDRMSIEKKAQSEVFTGRRGGSVCFVFGDGSSTSFTWREDRV
eukprot:m.286856 g.286856  ORF g.286856 m.286856 type:complete len:67 (-) comp162231_c0_seq1:57-257(-)